VAHNTKAGVKDMTRSSDWSRRSELVERDFDKKWREFSPDEVPLFGIAWGKDSELLLKVAQRLLDLEERVKKQEENSDGSC
jgi:hypothetical protein